MAVALVSPRKRPCPLHGLMFSKPAAITSKVLTTPQYSNKILSGLNELRQQELLCDYTLTAEGQEAHVHRNVMVACSDYFRALLTGDMRESKMDSVQLQGISSTGLKAIVAFAYTGSLDLNLDTLDDILAAASHLQVSEALDLCCLFIEKALTIENCVDMLNIAELYSLAGCSKRARTFITENFETLAETEQYFKLNNDQMATLLSEDRLRVVSEFKLFELVLRWVDVDKSKREEFTPQLMSHVRLPLLSGEELVEKVSSVEIMQDNVQCCRLLTEAKDYHIVVSKQPLLQNNRTQIRSEKKGLIMCHAENIECYDFESARHAFLRDAPVPLYNPCICVVDNFMYAFGGKYDSHENNEIATARCFRYDPRFDVWFELASMNEPRKDFELVATNNCLYAIAGQDENMVSCTMECFSIANNDWESRLSLTHAIYGHSGAYCEGSIYISGGQKFDGQCTSVSCYNAAMDTWETRSPLLNARVNHNMVAYDRRLFVIGGNVEDSYGFPDPVNNIEVYNISSDTWTSCESTLNIREAGACALTDKIFIVGGINGQHYYSELIHSFDPVKDKVEIFDRFSARIFGRACGVLSVPQYIWPN